MKFFTHVLLMGSFFLGSCAASTPHTCPGGGLDNARNCRRKCVESKSGLYSRPLPCECFSTCLCWKFAGHPRYKSPEPEFDVE
jgi:hypothetical protein